LLVLRHIFEGRVGRLFTPELHHDSSVGGAGGVSYGCIGSSDKAESLIGVHESLQETLTSIKDEVVRHHRSIDPEFKATTTQVLKFETNSIFGTELQRNPNTGFQNPTLVIVFSERGLSAAVQGVKGYYGVVVVHNHITSLRLNLLCYQVGVKQRKGE
jgi:hypothetical protein